MSPRELSTERAKLQESIRNRRQGLRDFDAASKDYQRWAINPPTTAEERAQTALPTDMIRGAIWKGLKGRADAPSGAEAAALAASAPDLGGLLGSTAARVGVGGAAASRRGAVTALQTARARIEQAIKEEEALLQSLPQSTAEPATTGSTSAR